MVAVPAALLLVATEAQVAVLLLNTFPVLLLETL
jgi:hypothetical protein